MGLPKIDYEKRGRLIDGIAIRISAYSFSAVTMPLSLFAGYLLTLPGQSNAFFQVVILAIVTGIAGPLLLELHSHRHSKNFDRRLARVEKHLGIDPAE